MDRRFQGAHMLLARTIGSGLLATLAACGGGGGGSAPAPAAPAAPVAPVAPAPTYMLGGTVSGLASGAAVTVTSGSDSVTVKSNGTFSFPTRLAAGASYSVSSNSPAGHTCSVSAGAGAVGSADVSNVTVKCTAFLLAGVDRLIKNGSGVAVDASGNSYVLDTDAQVILKIGTDNAVSLFAGTRNTRGHQDGPGSSATFHTSSNSRLVIDGQGNLILTDYCNGLVRKISPAGVVSTLAGVYQESCSYNLTADPTSLDNPAIAAKFALPSRLAVDASGNVAVSEVTSRSIRRISAGVVTTQDPLRAFNNPGISALAFDNNGALLVASNSGSQHRIWRIDGNVATLVAGVSVGGPALPAGTPSLAPYLENIGSMQVDKDGNILLSTAAYLLKLTPSGTLSLVAGSRGVFKTVDGTGAAASFSGIAAMAFDASGQLTVIDGPGMQLRKVSPAGVVTTSAATPNGREYADGVGAAARFSYADFLASGPDGNVYTLDAVHHVVRKIAPDGTVNLFAGSVDQAGSADGPVATATLNTPGSITVDALGVVYVVDANGLRKIDHGVVSTVASGANFNDVWDLRVLPGGGFVVSSFDSVSVLSATGVVRARIDAPAVAVALGLNPALASEFDAGAIEVDAAGNIYMVDMYHSVVLRYTPDGKLALFAGTVDTARNVDGPPGTGALSFEQQSSEMTIDPSGNLYLTGGGVVRKISPQGVISTPALAWNQRDVFGITVRNGVLYGTINAAVVQTPLP